MRTTSIRLLGLLFLMISTNLHAQFYNEKTKMKYGKVGMDELIMKSYERDTGAVAVVLADIGNTYFDYNQTKGFQIIFERHCRIKILKNSGYEYANIEIPIYTSGSTKEFVTNLKASTYNLENGNIIESKISKKDVYEDKRSEFKSVQKFSLPNVAVGSVLEFSYKITSDFREIREWYFQRSIPVAWSEYTLRVPQYYNFHKFSQGYEPFYIYDTKKESASIKIPMSNGQIHSELYTNDMHFWAVKDAPGMASEKYITTQEDFLTKVEFQIATINMPYSRIENVLADWPEVQKKLLEHEKFGVQINRSGFMKEELYALIRDCSDNNCKIAKVYTFVRQNMEWNEKRSFLCESNIRKAFNDKVGNSAEINLMLVSALREIGLEANPVILSTRDNGRIHPVYPIINKFNYVIAAVELDGKYLLLDATDKYIVPGQLPARCLNHLGRIISEKGKFIDIASTTGSTSMFTADMTIQEDGLLVGKIMHVFSGYDAVNKRKQILYSQDDYIKSLKDEKKHWEIVSHQFENLENLGEKLTTTYDLQIVDAAIPAGNTIFIHPLLSEGFKENPFKQETRKYPIDYAYPVTNLYQINLNVPEGYEVEELPEGALWALPNDGGRFSYNIVNLGSTIKLTVNYTIKKSMFLPDLFPALKEFHNLIVAKCAEQIVLKKKS